MATNDFLNSTTLERIKLNNFIIVFFCFVLAIAGHLLLPCSLESYEKYFSVIASGTYTDFGINDYDADVHFLLFSLYAGVNKIFPGIQVYGYVVVFYNTLSLSLFGFVLYQILRKKLTDKTLFISFPLIFLSIASYQIINLSSTRIVLISAASIFYLIYQNGYTLKYRKIVIILLFLFLSLIRIDAALLASVFFILISLIFKKMKFEHLIPFIASVSVFLSFNMLLSLSDREDKKVYYYRELDLFDKDNIDYQNISKRDSLYISLLTNYSIMDVNHFKMGYINKLIKVKSSSFINSFVDLKLFGFTFLYSLKDIFYGKWLILCCLILILLNIVLIRPTSGNILILILLFVFPVFLCFYISIPLRFIEPYYILYSLSLVIYNNRYVFYAYVLTLLILSYSNILTCSEKYTNNEINFKINYNYLIFKNNNNKPIVIESIETGNFFSPNPIFNSVNTNTLFLNFGFLNSYDCYKSFWRNKCNCNPLSLIDKLEFISSNDIELIINENKTEVYKKYIKLYWNRNVEFSKIQTVNRQVCAYKIRFK